VDLEHLVNIEELEGLHLDVMFGAVPKRLVGDLSKKFNKRKTKNLFYIIFGVYLKESNQYIVFSSVFKSSKKKVDKHNWFTEVMVDSAVFEDKQKVLDYLYDFMDAFGDHDRIINEEIMTMKTMGATEAFEYLLIWNKGIFQYFNLFIESENKKKSGLFI
jgi:aspartate/tyrosine/aromatic aminotransferase